MALPTQSPICRLPVAAYLHGKAMKRSPWAATRAATFTLAFAVMICFLSTATTRAEELSTGTGSKKARRSVVSQIPFDQLNEQTRRNISDVIDRPSMYRSLPKMAIQIDPEYLQFLIRYPEVVVNIWELMGITDMKADRTGAYTLDTDDGAGTTSTMELVYGSQDMHIYYGQGQYEGPVLRKKLNATCVIIVRTAARKSELIGGNQAAVTPTDRQMICQLDVFLKIQNNTAGLIVKTIQPIVGPTADHNFTESMKFIQRLNETTEDNGPGVQEMAKRFDVTPDVQQRFVQVVGNVFQRSLQRQRPGGLRAAMSYSQADFSGDPNSDRTSSSRSPVPPQSIAQKRTSETGYTARTAGGASDAYPPSGGGQWPYQQQSWQQPMPYAYPAAAYPAARSYGYGSPVQRAVYQGGNR